jgi:hypothetical protein
MAKYVPPFRKQEASEASEVSGRWGSNPRSDYGKSDYGRNDKSDTGRWDRINRNGRSDGRSDGKRDYGKSDATYGKSVATYGKSVATYGKSVATYGKSDRNEATYGKSDRNEATYGKSDATGRSDNRNKPSSDAASAMDKLTMEEFPSLSKKSVGASPAFPKGRMTYASLASNWAEQVKENEEKARKLAEEEAEKKRIQDKINEVKIVAVSKGVLPKRKSDSDDDKDIDIGCANSDHSSYSDGPDNYDIDVPEESEEEEEVEDPDAFWTQRKNKNDIY